MFINLTPHEVVVFTTTGEEIRFPPSGKVARIEEVPEQEGMYIAHDNIDIPYALIKLAGVIDLPEPNGRDIFIVSMPVAQAVQRLDVFSPDTGPGSAVRDESGRIIGVMRLRAFVR